MSAIVDSLFTGANLFVLPFWALMILLPNWKITQRLMESVIPFALLACVYIFLFAISLDAESAKALSSPQLADIARAFASERIAAAAWVHFLVMDLFVGRWIYREGRRNGTVTVHSLILCLFAGPMGLLSHIVTAWAQQQFFAPTSDAPPAESGT